MTRRRLVKAPPVPEDECAQWRERARCVEDKLLTRRAASSTLQRWWRREKDKSLQRNRAASRLQTFARCHAAAVRYNRVRLAVAYVKRRFRNRQRERANLSLQSASILSEEAPMADISCASAFDRSFASAASTGVAAALRYGSFGADDDLGASLSPTKQPFRRRASRRFSCSEERIVGVAAFSPMATAIAAEYTNSPTATTAHRRSTLCQRMKHEVPSRLSEGCWSSWGVGDDSTAAASALAAEEVRLNSPLPLVKLPLAVTVGACTSPLVPLHGGPMPPPPLLPPLVLRQRLLSLVRGWRVRLLLSCPKAEQLKEDLRHTKELTAKMDSEKEAGMQHSRQENIQHERFRKMASENRQKLRTLVFGNAAAKPAPQRAPDSAFCSTSTSTVQTMTERYLRPPPKAVEPLEDPKRDVDADVRDALAVQLRLTRGGVDWALPLRTRQKLKQQRRDGASVRPTARAWHKVMRRNSTDALMRPWSAEGGGATSAAGTPVGESVGGGRGCSPDSLFGELDRRESLSEFADNSVTEIETEFPTFGRGKPSWMAAEEISPGGVRLRTAGVREAARRRRTTPPAELAAAAALLVADPVAVRSAQVQEVCEAASPQSQDEAEAAERHDLSSPEEQSPPTASADEPAPVSTAKEAANADFGPLSSHDVGSDRTESASPAKLIAPDRSGLGAAAEASAASRSPSPSGNEQAAAAPASLSSPEKHLDWKGDAKGGPAASDRGSLLLDVALGVAAVHLSASDATDERETVVRRQEPAAASFPAASFPAAVPARDKAAGVEGPANLEFAGPLPLSQLCDQANEGIGDAAALESAETTMPVAVAEREAAGRCGDVIQATGAVQQAHMSSIVEAPVEKPSWEGEKEVADLSGLQGRELAAATSSVLDTGLVAVAEAKPLPVLSLEYVVNESVVSEEKAVPFPCLGKDEVNAAAIATAAERGEGEDQLEPALGAGADSDNGVEIVQPATAAVWRDTGGEQGAAGEASHARGELEGALPGSGGLAALQEASPRARNRSTLLPRPSRVSSVAIAGDGDASGGPAVATSGAAAGANVGVEPSAAEALLLHEDAAVVSGNGSGVKEAGERADQREGKPEFEDCVASESNTAPPNTKGELVGGVEASRDEASVSAGARSEAPLPAAMNDAAPNSGGGGTPSRAARTDRRTLAERRQSPTTKRVVRELRRQSSAVRGAMMEQVMQKVDVAASVAGALPSTIVMPPAMRNGGAAHRSAVSSANGIGQRFRLRTATANASPQRASGTAAAAANSKTSPFAKALASETQVPTTSGATDAAAAVSQQAGSETGAAAGAQAGEAAEGKAGDEATARPKARPALAGQQRAIIPAGGDGLPVGARTSLTSRASMAAAGHRAAAAGARRESAIGGGGGSALLAARRRQSEFGGRTQALVNPMAKAIGTAPRADSRVPRLSAAGNAPSLSKGATASSQRAGGASGNAGGGGGKAAGQSSSVAGDDEASVLKTPRNHHSAALGSASPEASSSLQAGARAANTAPVQRAADARARAPLLGGRSRPPAAGSAPSTTNSPAATATHTVRTDPLARANSRTSVRTQQAGAPAPAPVARRLAYGNAPVGSRLSERSEKLTEASAEPPSRSEWSKSGQVLEVQVGRAAVVLRSPDARRNPLLPVSSSSPGGAAAGDEAGLPAAGVASPGKAVANSLALARRRTGANAASAAAGAALVRPSGAKKAPVSPSGGAAASGMKR